MKSIKYLFICLVLTIVGCKSQKNVTDSTSLEDIEEDLAPQENSGISEEQIKKAIEEQKKEEATKTVIVKEEKITVKEGPENPKHKYYVIIGSFGFWENAQKYRSQLQEKGFSPVILENESGYYRVSVNSYKDETRARERIHQIRFSFPEHADTWLLVRKF